MELSEILKNVGLVDEINEEQCKMLNSVVKTKQFKKGQEILSESITTRDLYILIKGRAARIIDINEDDNDEFSDDIKIFHPYALIGELTFLDESRPTASVIAKTDVELLMFPHKITWEIMENNSQLGFKLIRGLAKKMVERVREYNMLMRTKYI